MKRGLLIIDRGSREREASEELEDLREGNSEEEYGKESSWPYFIEVFFGQDLQDSLDYLFSRLSRRKPGIPIPLTRE